MKRLDLNGKWHLEGNGYATDGVVPGSVYSILMENDLVGDPYYRDNEQQFLKLADSAYRFSKTFISTPDMFENAVILHCDGLDTLCTLSLNGIVFAQTDNMHRTYEFDISAYVQKGENQLTADFAPVDPYIKAHNQKRNLSDSNDTMLGFSYIRKAYYMMGWDWGPMLPDAGIWRDIYILVEDSSRITDFNVVQRHCNGKVFITPFVSQKRKSAEISVRLISPNKSIRILSANEESEIPSPQLWWPNGLGEQPLYTVEVSLLEDGIIVDSCSKKIGLRTLELVRERDRYGECFYHKVNGIPFFAMGGDYIPEDCILSRMNPARTRKLLTLCKNSHFNAVRVWGGGFYPSDVFYDICDELGLIVFQDLMFACTPVPDDADFIENIRLEVEQNLRRIRHHACLAVVSGNNEIEELLGDKPADIKENYLNIFEGIFPDIVRKICPTIPYVSSSPSTCGHFIEPSNENYGDSHFWEIWHGGKPFKDYRKHYFRYLSEFGFQSFPGEKTVSLFTAPEDRNIFSRIFELHQRNGAANKKILTYLADTFRYPTCFETLLYASQLLQAEAIRCGVEHFRRNRGRCMGTLYWQINDVWPVASWSSIDYYGRPKALQYVAKRFYAPVLLSCAEVGESETRPVVTMERKRYDYETKATLSITNDTFESFNGNVRWELRQADSSIIESGVVPVSVDPFSVLTLDEMDFNKTDVCNHYLSYSLEADDTILSIGSALFTAPKHFSFIDPHLTCEISGNTITVYAQSYARSVEIYSTEDDLILSDNFFDMNAGKRTVTVIEGSPKSIKLRSVYDIR